MKSGKKLFRLRGFPQLEESLAKETSLKIRKFRKQCPNIASEWRAVVTARPRSMRRTDYVKLRVLYQQFDVTRTPGLATLVRTARFLVTGIRKRLPGGAKP